MSSWVPFLTAIIGAIVGGVTSYVALRKDRRETRSQVIEEAKETIDLLKEQNVLLRDQLTAAEGREREWNERERRLEGRIAELEREYRTLVKTVSTMGLCADPQNCQAFKGLKK